MLSNVLAELYRDKESAERVATQAGVDVARVAFSTKASDTWSSLLDEASHQGRLMEVVRVALGEYPKHKPLSDALLAYSMPPIKTDGFMNPTYSYVPPAANESEAMVVAKLTVQLEHLTAEVKRVSDGLDHIRNLNPERIERGLDDLAFMRGRMTTLSFAVAIVTALMVLLGAAFLAHL